MPDKIELDPTKSPLLPEQYATSVLRKVCKMAGHRTLVLEARSELRRRGIHEAVRQHEDRPIFQWLFDNANFSGVSDSIAASFLEWHGSPTADEIATAIGASSCPKLSHFSTFRGCGYRKTAQTCSEPSHFRRCSVPKHDVRNGRLAQSAYSLRLFFRDVAQGDFVNWIDARLRDADIPKERERGERLTWAVVEPMISIHGISSKLVAMCMSQLLLGAVPERERWFIAGAHLVAVDSLVHAFLWRTGILQRFGAQHAYGATCYGEHGCAAIISKIARRIDARRFNRSYPRVFPRFIQHAVWRFCAENGLNICNGNNINDRRRCSNQSCELFALCDRNTLRPLS